MVRRECDKHGADFERRSHIHPRRHTMKPLHICTPPRIRSANTCCAPQEDHSISIREKSGLPFCSQPNLAARSPSALPSAGLSAACLEVNSFMIPLSVLPIFKWLILPLWQRLVRGGGERRRLPPSIFGIIRGHRRDNNPRLLPDMRYQFRIDVTKRAATTK